MRPLPERMPDPDRRFVIRVPQQPYLRFDSNDYSLDPRFAGRRVEVRVSQARDHRGRARHRRARRPPPPRASPAASTFTDPAHQRALERLRGERRAGATSVEVEIRPLARYDALIPA